MNPPQGEQAGRFVLPDREASSLPPDCLCCPACHGDLVEEGGGALCCEACDVFYPLREGYADFTAFQEMDEFSRRQHSIYDGREELQYTPLYADADSLKHTRNLWHDTARRHGLLSPDWKGMKSRDMMDRLAPREGERVLDVGCGAGLMLNTMHLIYGTHGVGIDFSSMAIEAAAACNPYGNDYEVADALRLPFKDGSFDLSFSFDAIEHVSDPNVFVREMVRVTRPGGRILIYTPSRRSRWSWHWWQQVMSGGKYGRDDGAGHDPDKFLTPQELSGLMRRAGAEKVETTTFHSLYTLILDEIFPGVIWSLWDRPFLCRAAFMVLELADSFLSDRDYGNGFYACGRNG